ncbi:pyridoxal phosphate-dependent aminotransferase [Paenibacillus sp. B01]|uniref:pyridoxal phosphate-dependent aminotransferase n=1 Tax=Paenibacillus sp. B01 TaxID=2660554 RepID=UPI00129A865A|nr:aminotransferase class I/II-fold pyridoxal phosphate-dependent enzyme [Paenibacillus sp. B01]QGG58084.1 aminotransferase class I/II-fold pyridoxal phosphate-dependent enzyme [Paenibacillus sp. B01]
MVYVNSSIAQLNRISYAESRKGYLRLDMNENPEGLPEPFLRDVLHRITPEDVASYPETTRLVQRLAAEMSCRTDQLCLTNGSDDAIRLVFNVFGKSGDSFVSVSPSFEMYGVYAAMNGMIHKKATYDAEFKLDFSFFLDLIDPTTRIVALLNPNSPIGRAWTVVETEQVIEKARENNAVVVIDEAYYYFSPTSYQHLVDKYDNVILLRTFSKTLSIAGARIGYIIADSRLAGWIRNASSTYPVNCFALALAESILDNPQLIQEMIAHEQTGRQYLIDQLARDSYPLHYSTGNYVLFQPRTAPQQLFDRLKERRILIKTYQAPLLKDWIRITTGGAAVMKQFWDHFIELEPPLSMKSSPESAGEFV